MVAERDAIQKELPKYNIQHNRRKPIAKPKSTFNLAEAITCLGEQRRIKYADGRPNPENFWEGGRFNHKSFSRACSNYTFRKLLPVGTATRMLKAKGIDGQVFRTYLKHNPALVHEHPVMKIKVIERSVVENILSGVL